MYKIYKNTLLEKHPSSPPHRNASCQVAAVDIEKCKDAKQALELACEPLKGKKAKKWSILPS